MPGIKGKTNNPNGRPPKNRALTEILKVTLNSKVLDSEGKKVQAKRLLSKLVIEAVTTGKVKFPDGKILQAKFNDWKDFTQWIYRHIDGGPIQELDIQTSQVDFTSDDYVLAMSELEEWENSEQS